MNLASVDLNLLVALEALIEAANVTHAAATVGLSQPAMSRTLRRLRALMNDPILMQTRHGMVPTPRARSLALPLRRALEQIRETLEPRQPFDPMAATDTFTLSWPDAGQIVLLPPLLQRLKREAPRVNLNIIYRDPDGGQYEALEAGEIDLGVEISRQVPLGFYTEQILDTDYICIARKHHPAIGKRLTLKQFLALGHIGLSPAGTAEPDIDGILAPRSATRRIALTVPSYLPIPWLVANSDLIATLPGLAVDMIAKHFPIRRYLPPIPIKPLPVSIIWHERTHHDPKYQWLRKTVVKISQELN